MTNLSFLHPTHLPDYSFNIRWVEEKLKFEGCGPSIFVIRRGDFTKIFDCSEKFPEGIKAFDLEVSTRDFMSATELMFRYREYFPKRNDENRKYGIGTLLGVLVRD